MEALLTVIVIWLSINFDLPEIHEHPRVEFVSAAQMVDVRYNRLASNRPDRDAAEAEHSTLHEAVHGVHAIYEDRSRTIYLPEDWSGTTPAEVSLLVHELVHHLQNVAGLKYDCPEAREKPAYRAQARWLELFDQSLVDEFGLDAMTVLVRTSCMR